MVKIVGPQNFQPAPFQDEVHDMGDFVAEHPAILGDDIVIVSRELEHGPDGRRLDFLVCDTEVGQAGIVELKKDEADEKVLLQTLRYADWLRNNPDTVRYQISRKNLGIDPDEIDVERIKIFIVAPKITALVLELSQYITAFDFEFLQLQRLKDAQGGVYAVTNPLEIQRRVVPPARERLKPDPAYAGLAPDRLELVQAATTELINICDQEAWELSPRHLKNAVKFQTGGGRNVFSISIRRRQDHQLRFCLGRDFDPGKVELDDKIRGLLRHSKPTSRWWSLPLTSADLDAYRPLLINAYSNVVG